MRINMWPFKKKIWRCVKTLDNSIYWTDVDYTSSAYIHCLEDQYGNRKLKLTGSSLYPSKPTETRAYAFAEMWQQKIQF